MQGGLICSVGCYCQRTNSVREVKWSEHFLRHVVHVKLYGVDVCRRRDDAEDREELRPGLLGDGPTPGRYFRSTYDEEEEEGDDYYYEDNGPNYDEDDGVDDENYAEGDSAQASVDVGLSVYCTTCC